MLLVAVGAISEKNQPRDTIISSGIINSVGLKLNKVTDYNLSGVDINQSCIGINCKIVLNKKGMYDNRVIEYQKVQVCENWDKLECISYFDDSAECSEYVTFCKKYSNYTDTDFFNMALSKELAWLNEVRVKRS